MGQRQTDKQIRDHYEIEKRLADRLRAASKADRRTLYTSLYDELFRLVPYHYQLAKKKSPESQRAFVETQMKVLDRLLDEDQTFLEVGAGDCALSFHVAGRVKKVCAVDVSSTVTKVSDEPENFELILSDGCSIPVPENSIDIVYSNQLMEHLHPDDAREQVRNILKALVPGGVYYCSTPNRLNGPHDISKAFDREATGFHLKEYTVTELSALFGAAGFSRVRLFVGAKNTYFAIPIFPVRACEFILERLPYRLRRRLASSRILRSVLNVRLMGVKAG